MSEGTESPSRRLGGRQDVLRILVADDHPIVRDGLVQLLELEDDIEVCGTASNGRELLEKVPLLGPDIILLDLKMPELDGLSAMKVLKQSGGSAKVIVLTVSDNTDEFVQAMKLGASGIVLKHSAPEIIVKAIRRVHAGEIWLDTQTTAAVMHQFANGGDETDAAVPAGRRRAPLSAREREVVALVAQGFKNKEMAERMFISEQTVKNHLHNVFDKLGVSDRLELALYAIHNGLNLIVEASPKGPGSTAAGKKSKSASSAS